MELIIQLNLFYKLIFALGFTAFVVLIGFIIFVLGYLIWYFWSYEDNKKRERERSFLNMKVRIDNLEKEIMKRREK